MSNIEANAPVSTKWSIHPGLVLKYEVMPERGFSASGLADAIEVARPGLTNMLNGKRAVTAPLAVKIEAALGYPAVMLLKLQAAHDLAEAKHEAGMAALVKRIANAANAQAAALREQSNGRFAESAPMPVARKLA